MLSSPLSKRLDALVDATHRWGWAATIVVSYNGDIIYSTGSGSTRAWDRGDSDPSKWLPTTQKAYPVTLNTRFDVASITKPIVATALLSLLNQAGIDWHTPVGDFLPEFRQQPLSQVTIANLLSHTAGFPAEWHGRCPDPGAVRFRRRAQVLVSEIGVPLYSCTGYVWAGILAEEIAGIPLASLVKRYVTQPLKMRNTGFVPNQSEHRYIPATEDQPGRGLIQGEVHDETAYSLGGICGNAGLFSTAYDLWLFLETLRDACEGHSLPETIRHALITPVTPAPEARTLGLVKDQPWMEPLGDCVGHTGFTGTAIAAQPFGKYSVVFLTNRVHPVRERPEIFELRRLLMHHIAHAPG